MRKTLLVLFLSLAVASLAMAAGNLKVAEPVADDGTQSYNNEPAMPLPLPMTSDSPGEVSILQLPQRGRQHLDS